jgi:competence protein ComEC
MSKHLTKSWLFTILVIFLALTYSASCQQSGDELLIATFLDVGQGDSIHFEYMGKNLLIDAGTQDMGTRVTSYLTNQGVTGLDFVVATHPHEDHIGGMIAVLNQFHVSKFIDSGQVHTSQTFENMLNLIDRKDIPYIVAERGQTIDFDPNITILVLSPPADLPFSDLNDNSVVLKVTYGQVSFLLMGDAGYDTENDLFSSGIDLYTNILKVGHHGSSYSSGVTFLGAVSPEVSIIQVGSDNSYGHPAQQTLSNLQAVGSQIYRTDTTGNVIVTTDGITYSVTTERSTSGYTTTSSSSAVGGGPFVGSSKSDKYHYPSCSSAKRISPANLVTFSSSAEARLKGYTPCGSCHPP